MSIAATIAQSRRPLSSLAPSLEAIASPLRAAAPTPASEVVQLPFTLEVQSQPNWCWAAVTVGISKYFSPSSPWTACSLVNAVLNLKNCCQEPASDACDQPCKLSAALGKTANLQSTISQATTMDEIATEIDAKKPICAAIRWKESGGVHFVVVMGYGSDTVVVRDPVAFQSNIYSYNVFCTEYLTMSSEWCFSYFTKPMEN